MLACRTSWDRPGGPWATGARIWTAVAPARAAGRRWRASRNRPALCGC